MAAASRPRMGPVPTTPAWSMPAAATRTPSWRRRRRNISSRSISDSLVFPPEAIRHLAAQVGPGQTGPGSDYPFPWQLAPVDHVFASSTLSDDEKADIL